jgi:hypothetical protein
VPAVVATRVGTAQLRDGQPVSSTEQPTPWSSFLSAPPATEPPLPLKLIDAVSTAHVIAAAVDLGLTRYEHHERKALPLGTPATNRRKPTRNAPGPVETTPDRDIAHATYPATDSRGRRTAGGTHRTESKGRLAAPISMTRSASE